MTSQAAISPSQTPAPLPRGANAPLDRCLGLAASRRSHVPARFPAVLHMARPAMVWLVTDDEATAPSASDLVLAAALEQRCAAVRPVSWQSASAWGCDVPRCDAAIIRSCRNGRRRADAYRDWLDLCSALDVPLLNSATLVREALDERHLVALPGLGARTVRLERADAVEIALAMDERGWREAVLKPLRAAGGHDGALVERHRLLETLPPLADAGPVLLQEVCPEIADGAWSLILVEGRYVHAVRTEPRARRDGGRSSPRVRADAPTRAMIADAEALVAALPERPLYARVDGVGRAGRLVALGLELNAPELFLDHDADGGAARPGGRDPGPDPATRRSRTGGGAVMSAIKHLRRRRGGAAPETDLETPRAKERAACGCEGLGLPLLAGATRDPLEALAIALVRFAMDGYFSGRVERWDAALRASIEVLGPVDGPAVLARVLALVLAVRNERRRRFRFMGTHCLRISEDEMELLAVIQAARRADADLLDGFAAMLVDRPDAPQVKIAAHALAAALDRQASRVSADRRRVRDEADAAPSAYANATRH
ncbi:hypothetical protein [Salinarimonas sp.]|uniref:ATP-grasp domain-containing protein n=1 Tax=Salinarimonas sp. TaxID=2766526 RepID=UPI0032D8C3C1